MAVHGFLSANQVISRHLFSDVGTAVRDVFGGKVGGITKAIDQAAHEAEVELCRRAVAVGADHVIGATIALDSIEAFGQAVLISGTAVSTVSASE